jgi:FKBP-type peptidyl-prolyl cis-trans isomerase
MNHRSLLLSAVCLSALGILAACDKTPAEPAPSASAARPAETVPLPAPAPQPSAAAAVPSVVGSISMSELGPLQDPKEAKTLPAPADVAAAPNDAKKTASGLALKVLTPGTGKEHPGPDDKVKVHYTGWTTDGKMFDSSVARGEPTSFRVSGVIKGWTEGLQLMTAGEKARLWIPAKLAYGETPAQPGMPAGMLVFDVELLEIATAPKAPAVPPDVKAAPATAKKTESGLAYRVLQKGTGSRHPKPTDRVKVHYSGWTPDGKMFDSSVTRGEPTAFGLNGVIKGWTEGVQLMVEGEKTRFWIPGALAYGDTPRPGAPGGPLVFDIELLAIETPPAAP